ncbi:MAG: Fur family transcriptional regulator, partial [Candidatus Muiribacteriaceae bacterium]
MQNRRRQRRCRCCGNVEPDCNWRNFFNQNGKRFTRSREDIIYEIMNSDHDFTVEDIYKKVRNTNSNIGIATVYRTVDLLMKNGFLVRFTSESTARYEIAGKSHHHQLLCLSCNEIIDYTECIDEEEKRVIKRIETKLSEKHGFKVMQHL